ncbi:MAG TPA: hypothetical protein VMW72_03990 [Sedimentisphaerales bacterium]|nr:hypothetical protein [Sedimentisphaerales bacterium]
MALTWKLSEIRAEVRVLASIPDTTQMSNDDVDNQVNDFYQNIFPGDVFVQELESWYTFDTADDDDCEKALPASVFTIKKPMTLKDSDDAISKLKFYLDQARFFGIHPDDANDEDDERSTPRDALLYNRTVYLRPKADEVFTFKAASTIKPTALNAATAPLDVRWGPAIAQGTAVLIKQSQRDFDAAKELGVVYAAMINYINRRDLIQKKGRSKPRW